MFHKISYGQNELDNLRKTLESGHIGSRGRNTIEVEGKLSKLLGDKKVLMTTSCTAALEMAVRLAEITVGDEVIVPTYTFPSTANAVLINGATPVLAPVDLRSLCITLDTIKQVRTSRTKAVMVVHYGGMSEDIQAISEYCKNENLVLIEDAAQALGSSYHGKPLGTFGDFGCFSFHQTKNETSGEGGALIINHGDVDLIKSAEIILEKGTNRIAFNRGEYDMYEWKSIGSSYSPSDLLMAFLSAQLDAFTDKLHKRRMQIKRYIEVFEALKVDGLSCFRGYRDEYQSETSSVTTRSNAHLFYLRFDTSHDADRFYKAMLEDEVEVRKHFVPLHQSAMGCQFKSSQCDFSSNDQLFDRIIRLPLYSDRSELEQLHDLSVLKNYFAGLKSCTAEEII